MIIDPNTIDVELPEYVDHPIYMIFIYDALEAYQEVLELDLWGNLDSGLL